MRKQTEEADDDDCDGGDSLMVISMANKNTALKSQNPSFHDSFFLSFLPLLDLCYSCVASWFVSQRTLTAEFFFSTFYWRMIMFWDEKELYPTTAAVFIVSWGHHLLQCLSVQLLPCLPLFSVFLPAPALSHTLIELTHSLSSSFNLLLSCNICSSAHHMQLTALLSNFFPITLFCIDPLSVIALSLYFFLR